MRRCQRTILSKPTEISPWFLAFLRRPRQLQPHSLCKKLDPRTGEPKYNSGLPYFNPTSLEKSLWLDIKVEE